MSFGYNEDLLQFIWENQLYDQKNLKTTSGETITILKQGYLNKASGPDFEKGKIQIGNTIHHGSIEIHIDSKDWENHGHQNDPNYNKVILHVCYSVNSSATRQDKTNIPSLELETRIKQASLTKYKSLMSNRDFIPCENQIGLLPDFDINNWLDRMIIERLEKRCELFQAYLDSSKNDWNQAFYISLVRTFGMPNNTESFEELAFKLPFTIVQKHHQSLFQLEALLFGVSGLLEDENSDSYYIGLQSEFCFLKTKYGLKTINQNIKFGRIRPLNQPHVKIAQLAAFIHYVPNFISKVLELPESSVVKRLLNFPLSDYWKTHYSFKKSSIELEKKVSSSFIDHLFLNSIVPFVFFYNKEKNNTASDKAFEYLMSIKSEKNSIINLWKSIGVNSTNASNSQALLHLYKSYCKPKRCLQCNLGKQLLMRK